ncbi:MAG: ThiF family adenylyltransferase, partial [Candidatus Gastranaerophilaceae bacterium]
MFSRNELIWGKENQQLLKEKHVVIFGVGAVGGYSAEMLTRCGVGKFTLVDFDEIDRSNLNRQIIALHSNIGNKKTAEFEKRLKDINPEVQIRVFDDFYNEKLNDEIFSQKADAVVDAIDTMKSKIQLLKYCK